MTLKLTTKTFCFFPKPNLLIFIYLYLFLCVEYFLLVVYPEGSTPYISWINFITSGISDEFGQWLRGKSGGNCFRWVCLSWRVGVGIYSPLIFSFELLWASCILWWNLLSYKGPLKCFLPFLIPSGPCKPFPFSVFQCF